MHARCVISCVNFFKNYTIRAENEIQNKNWQLSILVHITSRKLAPNHMSIDRSITKTLLNERMNVNRNV